MALLRISLESSGKGKKPETPRRRNEFVYEYLGELRTVTRGPWYIHTFVLRTPYSLPLLSVSLVAQFF